MLSKIFADELKKRGAIVRITVDAKGLTHDEVKILEDAIEAAKKYIHRDDIIQEFTYQWLKNGYPAAEKGGNLAQLVSEEFKREVVRQVVHIKGLPARTQEVQHIVDAVKVGNAKTEVEEYETA